MARLLKSSLLVLAGICWLLFAAAFVVILCVDLNGNGGVNVFAFLGISSLTVTLGLANVVGLCAAAFVCLVVGFGLCAYGVTADKRNRTERSNGC